MPTTLTLTKHAGFHPYTAIDKNGVGPSIQKIAFYNKDGVIGVTTQGWIQADNVPLSKICDTLENMQLSRRIKENFQRNEDGFVIDSTLYVNSEKLPHFQDRGVETDFENKLEVVKRHFIEFKFAARETDKPAVHKVGLGRLKSTPTKLGLKVEKLTATINETTSQHMTDTSVLKLVEMGIVNLPD